MTHHNYLFLMYKYILSGGGEEYEGFLQHTEFTRKFSLAFDVFQHPTQHSALEWDDMS